MSITSVFGGFVELGGGGTIGQDDPVGAAASMGWANNLLHAADSISQVRICDAGFVLTTSDIAEPDAFFHVVTIPFPLTLGADGLPYPVRTQLAVSSQNGVTPVNFRAALCASRYAEREIALNGSNVATATSSSSTPAWSSVQMLTMSRSQVADATQTIETIDGVGGDPVGVSVVLAGLSIWANVESVGTTPRLHGVYCAEYGGA